MLDAFPSHGRDLGLRDYEGRVDDLSPAGCAGELLEAAAASVAVGDIDTIRLGGVAPCDVDPSRPQPAPSTARTTSARGSRDRLIHPPSGRRMRGSR